MPPDPFQHFLLIFIAVGLGLIGLLLLPQILGTRRYLPYLVGASAGLFNVEIAKIHVFTILCIALAISDRRTVVHGRGGRRSLLIGATTLLALSVPLGVNVNDKNLALQLLLLASCGAFIAGRGTPEVRQQMLFGLFSMGVLGALVALGQKAGVVPYTPFVDEYGSRVTGIYHEPDWLGLYSAISLLLLFMLPIKQWRLPMGAVLLAALYLSGARAAWGAFLLAFVVMIVLQRKEERGPRAGLLATIGVVLMLLVLADPSILSEITRRLSAGGQLSAFQRTLQQRALNEIASVAPWHGLGLSASGHVSALGVVDWGPSVNNVASNWVLGWWVDAKYLAVPIISVLIGTMLLTVRRVGGLVLLLVLFNSLYSNAAVEPILWFAVGIALGDLPGDVSRQALEEPAPAERTLVAV